MKKLTFVLLVIFSLVPTLWFLNKGNIIINGVDTNFPLDPIVWFQRRLFIWNDVSLAGLNFSSSVSGIFFHFIQVVPYLITRNLMYTQLLSLVFWFAATVFSSYLFASSIFKKSELPKIIFVVLYCFNTYLFNTWENIKVSNLALVVGLPLLLAILVQLSAKKIKLKRLPFYVAISALITSGSGINPAYFITLLAGLTIYASIHLLSSRGSERREFIKGFGVFISTLIITNMFWIVPTIKNILFSNSGIANISDIGFVNWLDSLSQNTSILNVFRLLGAWDWYAFDDAGQPLYIPYAIRFINWTPFVIYSLSLPFMAISSLALSLKNKRKFYTLFGTFLIIGTFLGAGTHPPTGAIYKVLVTHIPFFSFFRSPWYIFTPLTIMGTAGLVALLFEYLRQKINHSVVITTLVVMLVTLNLIYSYPLILGRIFRPGRHDSFYVKFPGYVFETSEYLNNDLNGRALGYPDDEIEQFNWGYRGIESILNLVSKKETLFASLNVVSQGSHNQILNLYESLKRGELVLAESLAGKLNVDTLFYKNDQFSLAPDIKNHLSRYSHKDIGDWKLYDFPNNETPKIYAAEKLYFGNEINSNSDLLNPVKSNSIILNPDDSVIDRINNLDTSAGWIIKAKNNQLANYQKYIGEGPQTVNGGATKIDQNKVGYTIEVPNAGVYTPILESYRLEEFSISKEQPLDVEVNGVSQSWKIVNADDSFVYFESVSFSKGANNLTVTLKNRNKAEQIKIVDEERKDTVSSYNILDFNPLRGYLVIFDYKHIYGEHASVEIQQQKEAHTLKREETPLPKYPDWTKWSFYIQPVKSTSTMRVRLIAPNTIMQLGTKIAHQNVEIYEVFDNSLFLVSDGESETLQAPKVTYKKVSPVKYSGKVEQTTKPHVLTFAENYSNDWDIRIWNDSQQIDISKNHFSSNYYSNSWYVPSVPAGYEFEIYYKPQRLYDIARIISVIYFAFTIIIFIAPLSKKTK